MIDTDIEIERETRERKVGRNAKEEMVKLKREKGWGGAGIRGE